MFFFLLKLSIAFCLVLGGHHLYMWLCVSVIHCVTTKFQDAYFVRCPPPFPKNSALFNFLCCTVSPYLKVKFKLTISGTAYGVPPNPLVSFYIASIASVYELVLPCKMCQIGINQIINKKLCIHNVEIHSIFKRLNTENNKMNGMGTPAKAKKEKKNSRNGAKNSDRKSGRGT